MAIAIFVAGVGLAVLFGFLLTQHARPQRPGWPGHPHGHPRADRQQRLHGRSAARLPAHADHRRHADRQRVPPQDHQQHLPRHPQARRGHGRQGHRPAGHRCASTASLSLVGSVVAGAIVLRARGFDAFPSAGVFRTLALSLLVLGLWALIGLGAGILIPNQVAALLISIGVAWIVEPLIGFGLGFWEWGRDHVVEYLPTAATQAMVNGVSRGRQHRASSRMVGRRPGPRRVCRGAGRRSGRGAPCGPTSASRTAYRRRTSRSGARTPGNPGIRAPVACSAERPPAQRGRRPGG